jgi:hypothetical protein
VDERMKSELLRGLYSGLVCNLLMVCALNNSPFWESGYDLRVWLIVLGFGNEIFGVLLIASPELIGLVQWIRTMPSKLTNALDLFLWKLRGGTRPVGASLPMNFRIGTAHDRLFRPRLPDEGVTTEEFLLAEVRQLAFDIHNLDTRMREMPRFWQEEIEQAQTGAVERARELVRGLEQRNLALRLLGVGFVVLGLVLSGVGSLL